MNILGSGIQNPTRMDAFLKKAVVKTTKANQNSPLKEHAVPPLSFSEDPLITEFYNQLTPVEKIAHTIATEKLGTSYDVTRTHGYIRWLTRRNSST